MASNIGIWVQICEHDLLLLAYLPHFFFKVNSPRPSFYDASVLGMSFFLEQNMNLALLKDNCRETKARITGPRPSPNQPQQQGEHNSPRRLQTRKQGSDKIKSSPQPLRMQRKGPSVWGSRGLPDMYSHWLFAGPRAVAAVL